MPNSNTPFVILVKKEQKPGEKRVALIPAGVQALLKAYSNIEIHVQWDAGLEAGFSNRVYESVGAKIVGTDELDADVVLAVKEPQAGELLSSGSNRVSRHLRFLHPVGLPRTVAEAILESRAEMLSFDLAVADPGEGRSVLPILDAMSVIAGELAVEWAHERQQGTVSDLKGVVVGFGNAGEAAARAMLDSGRYREVCAIDVRQAALDRAANFGCSTCLNDGSGDLQAAFQGANVLIGAALVQGKFAPIVFEERMLPWLADGFLAVDIACDQAGCFFETRERHLAGMFTSHEQKWDTWGQGHIACVPNMPADAAERASTMISNCLVDWYLPHVLDMENGVFSDNARGAIVFGDGKVFHEPTADTFGWELADLGN